MEGKKSNRGLVAALIIFVVLSIGLGGYLVYDKLIVSDNQIEATDGTTVVDNENSNVEEEKKDSYQVLELSPIGGFAVLYNGEVYVNIYDSTPNIDYVYGDGANQTLLETRETSKPYNFGGLKVTGGSVNDSSKWLKLNVSNVKSIHNNEYGQDLSNTDPKYGIIMINNDKTVSYIGIGDLINGNTDVTKLDASGIDNVVNQNAPMVGFFTCLIDSEGNKIDVNTLIK